MKFEPAQYGVDANYGDWTKIFLNDLVVMGRSTVWLEANQPGARPARLPNARTIARLADVCKGDADRCALIHVTGAATRNLKADDLTEDHLEDWASHGAS